MVADIWLQYIDSCKNKRCLTTAFIAHQYK